MNAIDLRRLFVPLLLGGALCAAALPARADHRVHHSYTPEHRHYNAYVHGHHHHRSKPHYVKKHHHPVTVHGVVHHHYYYPPAPYHSPPARVYYSYPSGVAVSVPPIVIKLR